ncbi:hypothetical protein [Aureibacter tunicatorum]|uniref:Uncharacterized protein n=1 Tax=Aureibacter tunicatorum TaxID=866807 RepID=A0AAE4BSY8_9BACT|nr:hypothetical protein [Aureibacter tunicatorum]MDR6239308.1 hypothetical protein [Aureibacter tunicatorum]BDD04768.1 hypothetical protein AUTU_22510 [Aureibacter tunicatorum]
MNATAQSNKASKDNSKKSILARSCDPELSRSFAEIAPSLTGNAEYVYVTNDDEFFKQLKSRKWSVVYFAPGACRFSAAQRQIPGSRNNTANWSLDDYIKYIKTIQGDSIQIAQSPFESESLKELNKALDKAYNVK